MKVYIVGYRKLIDKENGIWSPEKISQEGYKTYKQAREYIETRPSRPVACSDFYFQNDFYEEYYIHEIIIK